MNLAISPPMASQASLERTKLQPALYSVSQNSLIDATGCYTTSTQEETHCLSPISTAKLVMCC